MRKIILIIFSSLIFLTLSSPVMAANGKNKEKGVGRVIKEIKETLAPSLTGSTAPQLPKRQQIWERLRQKFPKLLPAGISQGKIVSLAGQTLPTEIVVNHEGKSVTLRITTKTLILRKYGGQAALSELKEGDIVSARGTWEDNEKAILNVRVLRDLSLEKRQATFWGKITNLGQNSFSLETAKRGVLTVTVDAGTKIVDRREQTIPFSSLANGHRVRVTGLWDVAANKLEKVKLIKDWSLGPITPTPTPL